MENSTITRPARKTPFNILKTPEAPQFKVGDFLVLDGELFGVKQVKYTTLSVGQGFWGRLFSGISNLFTK